MPDTFIIRLVSDELAAGRLVGIVESVRTGDAISIHDVEGLCEFLVADRRRDHDRNRDDQPLARDQRHR